MLKLSLLVAVCLFSLSSGENVFQRVHQRAVQKMQDIGQGACDRGDLCGVHGECMEFNGDPFCSCTPPYSGKRCDKICILDQCFSNFFKQMAPPAEGMPGRTLSARYFKRVLKLEQRLSAMGGIPGEAEMMAQMEAMCRSGVPGMVNCVSESLKNGSYCAGCERDKVYSMLLQLESKDTAADMYCDMRGNCTSKETTACVEQIEQVFTMGDPESPMAMMTVQGLDDAKTCLTKLISGELSLDGCTRNVWLKEESFIPMIDIMKAELEGCPLTRIGEQCSSTEKLLDTLCGLPRNQQGVKLDEIVRCTKNKAQKVGTKCAGAMGVIAHMKPYLMKECAQEAKADKAMQVCRSAKRSNKLADVIRALSPKQEKTLLKELLHELADE